MDTSKPLDHITAVGLLRPSEQDSFQAEDINHSWLAYPSHDSDGQLANPFAELSSIYKALEDKPLLRVWDTFSGSIPDSSSDGRMLARSPREALATRDARKTSLTTHANNSEWEGTPYISFTSRPNAASDLAEYRRPKRGNQYFIAIDPRHRLRRGLPILDMGKEMELYGVEDPYPDRDNYFVDHYVCLWEVTPAEVVGTWRWDELRRDNGWYENVIMPAFKEHRAARQCAV